MQYSESYGRPSNRGECTPAWMDEVQSKPDALSSSGFQMGRNSGRTFFRALPP